MNINKAVIAVIDDEASICKGLERLVRSAGLTAKTFLTGSDFLSYLETDWPACAVLDLNMMPMDGFTVLKRLGSKQLKLPVIIMTGDDSEEKFERAMKYDIVAYLLKPVDGQVLLHHISGVVGGQEAPN